MRWRLQPPPGPRPPRLELHRSPSLSALHPHWPVQRPAALHVVPPGRSLAGERPDRWRSGPADADRRGRSIVRHPETRSPAGSEAESLRPRSKSGLSPPAGPFRSDRCSRRGPSFLSAHREPNHPSCARPQHRRGLPRSTSSRSSARRHLDWSGPQLGMSLYPCRNFRQPL